MYPELFRIGEFPINTYGLLLATALMLGLYTASRLAGRDGLPRERIFDLGLWILISGLVGAKALLFFVEDDYRRNPWNFFSLDFLRSGGVFYGGLIGGMIAAFILIPWYKLNLWKTVDAFAPALALGQAIGRQGCFAAGCCYGKETSLPWGIHFTELANKNTGVPIYDETGHDLFLHPTQLYESFAMFAVFGFLFWLHKRKKFDGQVLISYLAIYPIIRFTIEFFRGDPRGSFGGLNEAIGLSTSQIISLAVAICAIIFLVIRMRKPSVSESSI